MKFGVRKPSFERSIKARTTGRIKRTIKKEINPLYGTKSMGVIRDPKKSLYNRVYDKTTVGTGMTGQVFDVLTDDAAGGGETKQAKEQIADKEPSGPANDAAVSEDVARGRKKFLIYAIILLALSVITSYVSDYVCTGLFIASMYCFYHRRTIRLVGKASERRK